MVEQQLTRKELEEMGTRPTERQQSLKRWVWKFCLTAAYARMAKSEELFWDAQEIAK